MTDLVQLLHKPLNEEVKLYLIKKDIYHPSILFRDSSEIVTNLLIDKINSSMAESLGIPFLLEAITWTRNNKAATELLEWRNKIPLWKSKIKVDLFEYLPFAGWSIDNLGKRKDLFNERCLRLLIENNESLETIDCLINLESKCPVCDRCLRWLFDFTNLKFEIQSIIFSGKFSNAPRKFLFCIHCSMFGKHIFAKYNDDHTSVLIDPEEKLEYDEVEVSQCSRFLSRKSISPFSVVEAFSLEDSSTIGGMPSWWQNREHPKCISCNNFMQFFGQLEENGMQYAFFCGSCKISVVLIQDT